MITSYADISAISGRPKEESHHLIYGYGMRELADKDGLILPLTTDEHRLIHSVPTVGQMSKIIGQLAWEKEFYRRLRHDAGIDPSRDAFRKRYGISYL